MKNFLEGFIESTWRGIRVGTTVFLIYLATMFLWSSFAHAAAGTIFIDTGGSATNSGSTDVNSATIRGTAAAWTTATTSITLDTNTNISGVAGCSAGTCDGSQSIWLTNATNNASTRAIFWILSYTGCTGTGACSIVVDTAVTCTTCSANAWAVGGRLIYPSGSTADKITNALRPGDTMQFNNSPATKTVCFFNTNISGTSAGGRINFIGKAGVSGITIGITSASTQGIFCGSGGQYYVANLTLSSSGGTTQNIFGVGGGQNYLQNVKIVGSGSNVNQHCIGSSSGSIIVMDSELTGCGGSGISNSSSQSMIINNYIHGNGVDGLTLTSATNMGTIRGNVISSNGGRGIYRNNATAASTPSFIDGNTIYGNGNSGIEVSQGFDPIFIRNNIIQSTTTAVATVKWVANTGETTGIHDHNVFWNSADSNSGLTNVTANATEFTSDPLMNAPGLGDFSLASSSSPAASSGYLGVLPYAATSTGFRDIGAIQRQANGAGVSAGRYISN